METHRAIFTAVLTRSKIFATIIGRMANSSEAHYKHQNISADNQPPVLTPEQIPSGYQQVESGLLVKTSTIGHAAMRSAEQMDSLRETKEILRTQKTEVLAGYAKFTEDLGEEILCEKDFDRTLAFSLKKWEADGSLAYLHNWLERNPGHKIYLSASPGKVLPRKNLREAGETLLLANAQCPRSVTMNWGFLFQYSDEEIWGKPRQDNKGNDLPVQLAVWTDERNLDEAPIRIQRRRIKEMQRFYGSASDQTIPQILAYWYRLRESEDFGGVGVVADNDSRICGEQLLAEPKNGDVPGADMGVEGPREARIDVAGLADDDPMCSRFIIVS